MGEGRMSRGMKKSNEYARLYGHLYARIPKAVFAAVAASYGTSGGDSPESAIPRLLEEWTILHAAGIVPQRPPVLTCEGEEE